MHFSFFFGKVTHFIIYKRSKAIQNKKKSVHTFLFTSLYFFIG